MIRRRAEPPGPPPEGPEVEPKVPDTVSERQRATAEYLTDMILELRNLARSAERHAVMVPLEFAYYEAFGVAHRVDVPSAEIERIRSLSRAAEEMDLDAAKAGG